MAYTIFQHLGFHVWAVDRLCQTLDPVKNEIIFAERKSSFTSIAKTLQHMWGAEMIWMLRMQGESPSSLPQLNAGDKSQLLTSYKSSANNLKEFAESKRPEFLTTRFKYKNLKGDPFEDAIEETLFHVVNHGTYHRGQVVTMLREADITSLMSMDLIHYFRTLRK